MQSAIYLVAAVVVLLSGLVAGRSGAAFTDTGTPTATFTTGSVNIALSADSDCDANDPGSYSDSVGALVTSTGNLPGTVATASVCIKNQGSLTTRWSLSGDIGDDAGGALESVLRLRIWSLTAAGAAAGTACVNGFSPVGTDLDIASSQTNFGASLYTSTLLDTDPSIPVEAATEVASGGYVKVCFSLVLPSTVIDSSLTNKTATLNFTITGNQA